MADPRTYHEVNYYGETLVCCDGSNVADWS